MYSGLYIKIKKSQPVKEENKTKTNITKLKAMRSLLEDKKEIKKRY